MGRHGAPRKHRLCISRVQLSENLAHGRMALHEKRNLFKNTRWESRSKSHSASNEKKKPTSKDPQTMRQVWFWGRHSSVGGGDDTRYLSDIPFAWMLQKISNHTGLECDRNYLRDYIFTPDKSLPKDGDKESAWRNLRSSIRNWFTYSGCGKRSPPATDFVHASARAYEKECRWPDFTKLSVEHNPPPSPDKDFEGLVKNRYDSPLVNEEKRLIQNVCK
jgi:Uncharacterized alpha/beta hydrolase domain (DUF2235)